MKVTADINWQGPATKTLKRALFQTGTGLNLTSTVTGAPT